MKTNYAFIFAAVAALVLPVSAKDAEAPASKIDYPAFVELSEKLAETRLKNRITEEEFIAMSGESGTVILDARSKDKYDNIHIKGAIHLALTDFTEQSLAALIPDKSTRILIYCNNNFGGDPLSFPSKRVAVALNIQTYINLHAYGYENVRELAPFLEVTKTKIPFEGTTLRK